MHKLRKFAVAVPRFPSRTCDTTVEGKSLSTPTATSVVGLIVRVRTRRRTLRRVRTWIIGSPSALVPTTTRTRARFRNGRGFAWWRTSAFRICVGPNPTQIRKRARKRRRGRAWRCHASRFPRVWVAAMWRQRLTRRPAQGARGVRGRTRTIWRVSANIRHSRRDT